MSDDAIPADLTRFDTKYGVFFVLEGDFIGQHLANFGAHTRNELAMVLDHIDEGDVIIDIGAHIGTYAIPMARKAGPEGRLLAIEGSPQNYALLQRNVEANGLGERISAVNAVIGEGNQKLRRVEVGGNTGGGFYKIDAVSGFGAADAAELICCHGFELANLIKIDIEGMELFALRSLASVISAHRPKVYMEVATDLLARYEVSVSDIEAFFRPLGYRFFRNAGARNSAHDAFVKKPMASLDEGGRFFDLLALPE